MYIKNLFGHFFTITNHRNKVFWHCIRAGIPVRGLMHDISKYSFAEFWIGVKYYQGGNRSPNEEERSHHGCSMAWMHHKGRNRHHFEYWTDYWPPTKTIEAVKMPTKFVIEMFCDRIAACKVYMKKSYTQDAPLNYYLRAKGRLFIHKETDLFLEKLLTLLAEKGEKETFKYIRTIRKKDY